MSNKGSKRKGISRSSTNKSRQIQRKRVRRAPQCRGYTTKNRRCQRGTWDTSGYCPDHKKHLIYFKRNQRKNIPEEMGAYTLNLKRNKVQRAGKTANLKKRINKYHSDNEIPFKTIAFYKTKTKAEADKIEDELILKHQPKYNKYEKKIKKKIKK